MPFVLFSVFTKFGMDGGGNGQWGGDVKYGRDLIYDDF